MNAKRTQLQSNLSIRCLSMIRQKINFFSVMTLQYLELFLHEQKKNQSAQVYFIFDKQIVKHVMMVERERKKQQRVTERKKKKEKEIEIK